MLTKTFQQLMEAKIYEEAFSIEQVYFTKTDKKINPKKQIPFKYWPGNIPVLISAPHSVRHERRKKIKVSDQFTGSLAYLIHKLTGAHALAVTRLYGGDPNFDNPCIYKDYLAKISSMNKIYLLIDLHGAAKDREFDIDFGTMNGASLLKKDKILEFFHNYFNSYNFKEISSNNFAGSIQNTVIKFSAQQLMIPAIQLEINRKYRAPNQNPEAYCRLVSALVDSINKLIIENN